jgi:hypothetical protein
MKKLLLIISFLLCVVGVSHADTQIANDNFNRAACASSCGSGGQLGPNWYNQGTSWRMNTGGIGMYNWGGNDSLHYSNATFANDQYSLVTGASSSGYLSTGPSAHTGPAVRLQASANSGYVAACSTFSSPNCTAVQIWKATSGTFVALGSPITTTSFTDTVQFMLKATGTNLTVWVGGVQQGSAVSDSTYSTGYPGVSNNNYWGNGMSGTGILYWEGGNVGNYAASPFFSPNGVALGFTSPATTVTLSTTTGAATIVYTTDGTTPTANGSCVATNGTGISSGGTVSLSSVVTLQAITCATGYITSGVTSALFTLYPDQPIAGYGSSNAENFSEFFNPILNIDSVGTFPAQLPLITTWTGTTISSTQVSAWTGMNTTTGYYVYPAVDPLGTYGIRGPGAGMGYAVRTAEVYPPNQYSKVSYHALSGAANDGVAVGTNCNPGSAMSGDVLAVETLGANNLMLYIDGSQIASITLAPSEGDVYEMRQFGTICTPLKNGVQVTGLNASYACAAATHPVCVGAWSVTNVPSTTGYASGYNWSGGAVATSNPGVTPISWSGNTYSNYAMGTVTSGTTLSYPTWQADGNANASLPTTGLICCNAGNALSSQYAMGSSGGASGKIQQGHLIAPFQNVYWVHSLVTMDGTAWNHGNWFLKFASSPYNPPSALSQGSSGCYDSAAGYIGVEPMMQGAVPLGASVEYGNTHKLHVTFDNNFVSTLAVVNAVLDGSGHVSSINVTNGNNTQSGAISTQTEVLIWGGGGTGATAHAVLSSGSVTSVVVDTGGSGYTSTPYVTIIPYASGSGFQACQVTPNYNIRTAIGFDYSPMHGDEILGVYNQTSGLLKVYAKSGATLGGWTANTAVTARVIGTNTSGVSGGVTGTTIEVNGLYQVAATLTWTGSGFQYTQNIALGEYVSDGSHWQKVTTLGAGVIPGSSTPPSWNHSGGTTTLGNGVVFTDMGTLTTPTTGSSAPSVWGGQFNTCETDTQHGALTVDGTVTWQCVGEAAVSTTTFVLLGSVTVPGFNDGYPKFPGIWANNNSPSPSNGEFAFQDVQFGSGDPCSNGKYTCSGNQESAYIGWVQ